MITPEEHRERILAAARTTPVVDVPLSDALGLVLAQDVTSRWPVPLFDNSAMDGYALRRDDATAGARLQVVADVPAGSGDDPALGPGEAARIMTGAPVPTDADAIVPLEDTDLGTAITQEPPQTITVTNQPRPGAHIRRRGEDADAESTTVVAGTELGAWQLSAIASAGHDRVRAYRRVRAAVVSTGSELVPPGSEPGRGQIPESNSVLLAAALREAGAEVPRVETTPDDEQSFRDAVDRACADADAVIFSGGASVGAFDVVKAVLAGDSATASVRFDRVAVQPGKPQGFGTAHDGTLLFCLPGNPVSVATSFEMFVRPALRTMCGHAEIDRPRVTRIAADGWRTPPQRMQVLPAVYNDEIVQPASAGGSGSHLVSSLADAEGLALIPADVDRVEPGDSVTVMEMR